MKLSFRIPDIFSANSLVILSDPVPGAPAVTIRIGLSGYSALAPTDASAMTAAIMMEILANFVSSFIFYYLGD
jgi:hypothetical protein